MVMAESERGTVPDTNNTSATTARLQWLRQRREALQDKLAIKNNELKKLCIDEAQLTGVLPPETPLDPGESPPIFKKRFNQPVVVSPPAPTLAAVPPPSQSAAIIQHHHHHHHPVASSQNTINKVKTYQAEESSLELERKVQNDIANQAFAIVNNPEESKTVRRKNRQIYQQSQRRLKELEIRLNFIRQGYGGHLPRRNHLSNPPNDDTNSVGKIATKHRIKKPRPPLESTLVVGAPLDKEPASNNNNSKTIYHETDFGSTPLDYYRSRIRYMKHPDYLHHSPPIDHNDNPDPSIYPDHYRARTYSHGNIDDSNIRNLRNLQLEERAYKNTPANMYNLEVETRDNQQWQQQPQRKYLDNSGYHHQLHANRQAQRFYYQDRLSPRQAGVDPMHPPHCYTSQPLVRHQDQLDNHFKENLTTLRSEGEVLVERVPRRNTVNEQTLAQMPRHKVNSFNDNWSPGSHHYNHHPHHQQQQEEGITMWYPDNSNNCQQDKFASLDRRKNIFPHNSMKESATSPHLPKYGVSLSPVGTPPPLPPPPSLPPSPPPHTRVLLRTQSLGSVEKWHSAVAAATANSAAPPPPLPHHQQQQQQHYHHYTGGSATSIAEPLVIGRGTTGSRDKEWYENSVDYGYKVPPTTIPRTATTRYHPRSSPSPSSISTSPKPSSTAPTPPLPAAPSPNFNQVPSKSEKDLEIPAESSNHSGKYQSYREVTKPFEMSDFYKYSTKFRKKQEQVGDNSKSVDNNNQGNFNGNNNNNANFTNNNNVTSEDGNFNAAAAAVHRAGISGGYIPPAQRRVYDRPAYPPNN